MSLLTSFVFFHSLVYPIEAKFVSLGINIGCQSIDRKSSLRISFLLRFFFSLYV